MDQAKPRKPYAKTAARRAEILRAARDSFAEHGYAGASLRDIAERAGTTHGLLLHHFRGKDELLAAVLAQRDSEEREQGQADVHGPGSLASYLGDVLINHQETPELTRLWLELAVAASRPDHPARAYFVDRYEHGRTDLAGRMRELAAQGKLRDGIDPQAAAALFYAVLNGLQMLWLLDPELDVVEPLRQFLNLVFPDSHPR